MHDCDPRVLPRLQRDWARLRHHPDAIATARAWHLTDQPFADLDDLLALCGYDVAGSPRCDARLRAVVVRAAHDVLAARLALQRILPGLVAVARRRGRRRPDANLLEELIGAAWLVIREFDPARRPSCLAAALIAGAEHRAFGRDERRQAHAPATVPADALIQRPVDARPTPCEELAALMRAARADGVPDEELELVRALVRAGSPGALAAQLGVTPRTVRNRRDRITVRMRRAAWAA